MKQFDLCGVGAAIVDVIVPISELELAASGQAKGTMRLCSITEQVELLDRYRDRQPRLVSGGSVANSIILAAQIGIRTAQLGVVGDDRYGLHYQEEFLSHGAAFPLPPVVGERTGTCLVQVTPDAERTMSTALGVSAQYSASTFNREIIGASSWLFLEGYLYVNAQGGAALLAEATRFARSSGTKVALTLSESFVVQAARAEILALLPHLDMVFANEGEAIALTGEDHIMRAVGALARLVPTGVVTLGERGAYCWDGPEMVHVPATPCQPKDLTGAGDALAGGTLAGVIRGVPLPRAVAAGCAFAGDVISQIGARLSGNLSPLFQDRIRAA